MNFLQILAQAVRFKIPVYMMRVAANKQLGEVLPDEIWKQAVEKAKAEGKTAALLDQHDVIVARSREAARFVGQLKLDLSENALTAGAPIPALKRMSGQGDAELLPRLIEALPTTTPTWAPRRPLRDVTDIG